MRRHRYGDLTPEQEAAVRRLGLIKDPPTLKERLHQLKLWTREHTIGVTAWCAFLLTTVLLEHFAAFNANGFESLYLRSVLLASWTFLFPFYLHWRHKGVDVAGGISGGLAGYAVIAVLLALHDQSWWIICIVWGIHYYSALRIAEAIGLQSDANQEDIPLELDPPGSTPPSKPKQTDCLTLPSGVRLTRSQLQEAHRSLPPTQTMPSQTKPFITPEQGQKLLPVLVRTFDAAFRLGYTKFKDAAKFVLDQTKETLGEQVADQISLEHLQAAYISLGKRVGVDSKRDVVSIEEKSEIESHTAVKSI